MSVESEKIRIDRVNLKEIKELVEVYKDAYAELEEYAYTSRSNIKGYLKWLYKRDPMGFFVAYFKNRPVGFISVDSRWYSVDKGVLLGEIHEVVVIREFQGKGIGKRLFETGLSYLKSKGIKNLELWVGENNRRARKFYRKYGFKEVEKRWDWVRMTKKLD
ncbi:MAG: GNAT family N-acetyltransferase [Candidatus Hydrothermarchaeota archaeon]